MIAYEYHQNWCTVWFWYLQQCAVHKHTMVNRVESSTCLIKLQLGIKSKQLHKLSSNQAYHNINRALNLKVLCVHCQGVYFLSWLHILYDMQIAKCVGDITFTLWQLAAREASRIAFPSGWFVFDSTPAARLKISASVHLWLGKFLHKWVWVYQ